MKDFNRRLMFHGMRLFRIGLLTGAAALHSAIAMGLATHLERLMNRIYLLALGAIWTQARLSTKLDHRLLDGSLWHVFQLVHYCTGCELWNRGPLSNYRSGSHGSTLAGTLRHEDRIYVSRHRHHRCLRASFFGFANKPDMVRVPLDPAGRFQAGRPFKPSVGLSGEEKIVLPTEVEGPAFPL